MAEITPTPQTITTSEPKYPEIEELKLDTGYLSSGKLSDLTKALGINMPSTGIKTRATADEVMFGVGSKLNNLTNQIEESKARKESEALDAKQKYYDNINEKEAKSTNESKEKLKKLTEAGLEKFAPTQENVPQLAALFSTIGILGAIIGGGGRNSAMNALSSMTGMLEGYKKGQMDRFKQEKVMFDSHLAQLKVERENIIQEMKQIADEYVRDREKGKEKFDIFMAKLNSQVLKDINKVSGIQGVMKALFTSTYDGIKNIESLNNQLTMESVKFQHQKELKRMEKTDSKTYQDYFPGITFAGGVAEQREKRDAINNGALSLATADDLKKYAIENRNQLGRQGQVAQNVERYFDSIKTGKGLENEDDKGQPALIFAKRYAAYLVGYEKSLAGSNRGMTVQFQKRFNDLMAQNQFNSTGFETLMNEQMNEVSRATASKDPAITGKGLFNYGKDIYGRGELFPEDKQKTTKIPTVKSKAEYDALPSGSQYYEDDGKLYRKP
jgi:hypothetical protein